MLDQAEGFTFSGVRRMYLLSQILFCEDLQWDDRKWLRSHGSQACWASLPGRPVA